MIRMPAASRTSAARRLLAGLALALVTTVGCVSETAGTPHPAPAPPPPSAADDSDLGACQDGICEVRIEESLAIPVDARYGAANLRGEAVGPPTVMMAAERTRASRASSACTDESPPSAKCGSPGRP
ncbi:hypothetical protein [Pseudonocardia adelaidensis]|uniref:Secreted protein n=1 Tax=Pseudonocardia adelaidensis TaxID=648754 RepID=A0ABP9NDR9_9PSEU